MTPAEELAARMLRVRTEYNVSQASLADLASVSRGTIRNAEAVRFPEGNPSTRRLIVQALDRIESGMPSRSELVKVRRGDLALLLDLAASPPDRSWSTAEVQEIVEVQNRLRDALDASAAPRKVSDFEVDPGSEQVEGGEAR